MDRVIDYPVPVLNWSHLHDNESLAEVRRRTSRCLIGGMDEIGTSQLTAGDVVESVLASAQEAKGGGFIAGPGCAVPADIPPDLIRAPREAVEMLRTRPTWSVAAFATAAPTAPGRGATRDCPHPLLEGHLCRESELLARLRPVEISAASGPADLDPPEHRLRSP